MEEVCQDGCGRRRGSLVFYVPSSDTFLPSPSRALNCIEGHNEVAVLMVVMTMMGRQTPRKYDTSGRCNENRVGI